MKRMKNKSAWILFGISLGLCIILIILMFFRKEGKRRDETDGTGLGVSVVFHGFAIDIPEGYVCYPYEDLGLLIYNEMDYSLLLRITEESFEDLQKNKEDLVEGTKDKGFVCLTGVKEVRIRNHQYLYFIIEYNAQKQYAIFTAMGADHSARVVLNANERTEQEALETAASILESARYTDQQDTSIYDYYLLQTRPGDRDYVSDAAILDEQGQELAGYGIPEGFYSVAGDGMYKEEAGYEQEYIWQETDKTVLEGNHIFVTVSLKPKEDTESAKEVIDWQRELWDLPISAVKQTERNGKSMYYIGNSHSSTEGEKIIDVYEFYAVMDLGDGNLYRVEAWANNYKKAMELETYEDFLMIKLSQEELNEENEDFSDEQYTDCYDDIRRMQAASHSGDRSYGGNRAGRRI